MSGRVPPKGPRALVGSMPATAVPHSTAPPGPQSSSSSPSSSSSSPVRRFSILPPTAPRILTNGTQKPANNTAPFGNGSRHSLNGHPAEILSTSIQGSSSSPSSVKGKNLEDWADPRVLQANGIHELAGSESTAQHLDAFTSSRDHSPVGRAFSNLNSPTSCFFTSPLADPPPQPSQPPSPDPPPPPSTIDDRDHRITSNQRFRIFTGSIGSSRPGVQISKSSLNALFGSDNTEGPHDVSDRMSVSSAISTRAQSPARPSFRPSPPLLRPPPSSPPSDPPQPPRSPPPPPPSITPPPMPLPLPSDVSPPRLPRASSPRHPPSFSSEHSTDETLSAAPSTRHYPSQPSSSSQTDMASTSQVSLFPSPHQQLDSMPPAPRTYSLPPWPPERTEFEPVRNMKVLYDPVVDKDRDSRYRALIETIRLLPGYEDRIKGKGKGKEILMRYDGEVVDDEPEVIVRDPRKVPGFKKLLSLRPGRGEFHEVKYEYDSNSIGPPPPTSVLITNLSPLTPNQQIRRHFGAYGSIVSFEPQIDKENGSALGIVFIKYSTHEDAKKCVAKENGRKLGAAKLPFSSVAGGDGEELRVVLDGEGVKLKAVLKELEERKRKEREAKKRREKEAKLKEANANWGVNSKSTSTSTPNSGQTPQQARQQGSHSQPHSQSTPANASLPPNAQLTNQGARPAPPIVIRKPPPALVRARMMTYRDTSAQDTSRHPFPSQTSSHSSSSTPIRSRPLHPSCPRDMSRSPSPLSQKLLQANESTRQKAHEEVLSELAKNGMDHVRIELGGDVREEEVQQCFEGFKVQKVLHDHLGWYVTFETADSARRAEMVLSSGVRTLAHRSVTITVHPPPELPLAQSKLCWRDDELADQAQNIIIKELTGLLEKDITERLVGSTIRRVVAAERMKKQAEKTELGRVDMVVSTKEGKPTEKRSLKGLSFKKERKRAREEECVAEMDAVQKIADEEKAMEVDVVERPPKKKQKKELKTRRVADEDLESEDDDIAVPVPQSIAAAEDVKRKRVTSLDQGSLVPVKKKQKWNKEDLDTVELKPAARSKASRKQIQAAIVREMLEATDESETDVPDEPSHLASGLDSSSLSPSRSPSPIRHLKRQLLPVVVRPSSPPLNPLELGICNDDEDVFYAKLALTAVDHSKKEEPSPTVSSLGTEAAPSFRKHISGSARTEGYYKISHAEKLAYVAQYALRATATEPVAKVDAPQPQHVTSSRSNRANARRRAQGLEEINQVQRAVALSKGETAASELSFKFNQLQTRKKHLRFARSPIHDWGLYAMERISRGEMVIEYVGEIIRAQIADKREKAYERQGIGSSYLFRIDEDLVVDATKKGNLGRLINHSCDPNCTAKIITIIGEKKIVIYAKQDIELGDEITYDYHFPIEQDKIPCLCGSTKCRGYLN